MKLKSIFFALITILFFTACKDFDDQVGSSIQPDDDLLETHSNKVYVESSSLLVDSVLSKSSNLFWGVYEDALFGRTEAEFISQIDSRLGAGGLSFPDSTSVMTSAELKKMLRDTLVKYNPGVNYGPITKVSAPTNVRAESVFFQMQYSDFFGDSLSLQSVSVYALDKTLTSSDNKYYTNTDVSKFCKKDNLLGNYSFTINDENKNGNDIRIKLNDEFGQRLVDVYQKGEIKTQAQFNDFLKGVYVANSLSKGCIIRIHTAGILIYYSYDVIFTITRNEEVVEINSVDFTEGTNPLGSSVFLSANRSVERVNLIKHAGLEENFSSLKNSDTTYTFTPAGMYTEVNVPFKTMVDSIKLKAPDITKVMFNSARLTFYAKTADVPTKSELLNATPNPYMLLIPQDAVVPFFHKNQTPDGISTFVAPYNNTTKSYTFDITKAVQNKLSGKKTLFNEKMVVVPIVVENIDNVPYYRQQLWITATMLHGQETKDEAKKPRVDMAYTKRR